jgi:hypothetical protein
MHKLSMSLIRLLAEARWRIIVSATTSTTKLTLLRLLLPQLLLLLGARLIAAMICSTFVYLGRSRHSFLIERYLLIENITSSMTLTIATRCHTYCQSPCCCFGIERLPPCYFFDDFESLPCGTRMHVTKIKRTKLIYKEQNAEFFDMNNMSYPPNLADYPDAFVKAASELSERAIETAIFAEATEPWPTDPYKPQFLDANMSLKFLYKGGSHSIFRDTVPTLACSTILWMRVLLTGDRKAWRVVRGKYLLRLIGYGDPKSIVSDDTCQTLAGNAFSAFAVGPVLLSVISHLGIPTPTACDAVVVL